MPKNDAKRAVDPLRRRTFLAAVGGATTAGTAGCLGSSSPTGPKHGDDLPSDRNEGDGYPPRFDDRPEKRAIDESAFDATTVDGAVLSPAPTGASDDPTGGWSRSDRIVCYCSCPHHLSSLRAAALVENGYESVSVVDEGFREWQARDYPVAGNDVTTVPEVRAIDGRADTAHARETAWVRHHPSGQREATPIRDDGTYRLELSFFHVTDASKIVVETPEYAVEAPLGRVTSAYVTGANAVSNDAMRIEFGFEEGAR